MASSNTFELYTKCEYPIYSSSDTYIVPHSAAISEIMPQEQRFEPLVAGYCKTCTSRTDIGDAQTTVLRFFCINTIEIYMEKKIDSEDVDPPKTAFDSMGMSYCPDEPDGSEKTIWFGLYGECIGSYNRTIKALFFIPKGVKYQKGSASCDPSVVEEEGHPKPDDAPPCLDGHESIAVKDGIVMKRKALEGRQGMVDNILEMDDVQRDLYLQYTLKHVCLVTCSFGNL